MNTSVKRQTHTFHGGLLKKNVSGCSLPHNTLSADSRRFRADWRSPWSAHIVTAIEADDCSRSPTERSTADGDGFPLDASVNPTSTTIPVFKLISTLNPKYTSGTGDYYTERTTTVVAWLANTVLDQVTSDSPNLHKDKFLVSNICTFFSEQPKYIRKFIKCWRMRRNMSEMLYGSPLDAI